MTKACMQAEAWLKIALADVIAMDMDATEKKSSVHTISDGRIPMQAPIAPESEINDTRD